MLKRIGWCLDAPTHLVLCTASFLDGSCFVRPRAPVQNRVVMELLFCRTLQMQCWILLPVYGHVGMQAQPSDDYIGGVSLTPDSRHVVAVGGDGEVRLLEMRRAGAQLASLACESALHCCLCDGMTAVMGSDDGHVRHSDLHFV